MAETTAPDLSAAPAGRALSAAAIVTWTIIIGAAIRIAMNTAIGFGYGEGYYLASARHLALSYFDQPPLALWLAHVAIALFGTGSSLLPRLPFIALFAANTWLMYRLGARLFGEAAGAWAAVLFNLSPLFTISVGGWVQPDAPLFFFLTAAAIPVVDLCFGAPAHPWRSWMLAGACFGLAMLSKYHAALILVGLVIFVATTPGRRAWVSKPPVLLAGLIAALIFAPVLMWNLQNHEASFAFQGGRIVRNVGLRFDWLLRSLTGQAVLIGLVIWPLMMAAFLKALRIGPRDPKTWLLCCLAIVPIIVFTAASLWAPLGWHFHWQGPGYLYLFPLLGKQVAEGVAAGRKATRNWLVASAGILLLFVGLVASQAATGWASDLLAARDPAKPYYKTNPTRELLEWRELRPALAARGLLDRPKLFVVTNKWFFAGKADVAVGDRLPVVCLSGDPRNIAYVTDDTRFIGWDAVIVIPAETKTDPNKDIAPYFASITPLGDVAIPLGGEVATRLHLYLAHDYLRPYPLPYGLSRQGHAGVGGEAP